MPPQGCLELVDDGVHCLSMVTANSPGSAHKHLSGAIYGSASVRAKYKSFDLLRRRAAHKQ